MRNDRRTPSQLQELINNKVRVNLTSWEKRNIKESYEENFKTKLKENCGSCWLEAIRELARLEPNKEIKPILVKEKMIVHEEPVQETEVNEREELFKQACDIALEKGIKKPHSKTGIEKLEIFIKENK